MIGHDDPRHGSNRGYLAGCHEACCRAAHMRRRKHLRLHPNPLVDVLGTRRRVEALAVLGWDRAEISRRLCRHRDWLHKVLLGQRVQPATAAGIAALYDELRDVCPLTPYARRISTDAIARGAVAPDVWVDIDDPAEDPWPAPDPDLVDDVVVERILAGGVLPCTPAERRAVLERAARFERTLADVCRQMGWNQGRYYRASQAAGDAA